ncbi:nuclear transport factor 2 family protein [Dactylosporangium sp. NPDC006015]|uniref:nuclear transport factor 2 family protein n=1 Tax=Dactylosporangium sp. NPDC006015 TaxID=3154576 RepID=UPI0033B64323
MSDAAAAGQVVLLERQARDRGWWDQMRACYWPDSTVALSWYTGDGPGFVDASRAMAAAGNASVHRLSPPVVQVVGDRAFAEVPAAIEVRTDAGGTLADLVSYTRIVYRLERRGGRWGIVSLVPVYERDTLTPAVPGQRVHVPPEELAPFRAPYALLGWLLAGRGYPVGGDLLGDEQPDRTAAFYADTLRWLSG